jgi:hypothetical protein
MRPSFVMGLLCLVLASTWCAAASPFRSSLTSSTTPQFAAEALQKTQFQQLSTARLLPGRSGAIGGAMAANWLSTPQSCRELLPPLRLNSISSGSSAHAWNVPIGAHSTSLMQRSIWFARKRHFPDNRSAESARVACPSCKTSQPIPASHFPARRGWSKLSRGLREAGVACLSIAASRPKLHVQQHSPLNRQMARCCLGRRRPRAHG